MLTSAHCGHPWVALLHLFLWKLPPKLLPFLPLNILCWIDLVSPQFFPSMHPLTHFAIQAWGGEKMRCQNIIISSSSPSSSILGGYYPSRLSEENIRIYRTNVHSQVTSENKTQNQLELAFVTGSLFSWRKNFHLCLATTLFANYQIFLRGARES